MPPFFWDLNSECQSTIYNNATNLHFSDKSNWGQILGITPKVQWVESIELVPTIGGRSQLGVEFQC